MIRAKFKCVSIEHIEQGYVVKLHSVVGGSKENEIFFKYTPSAEVRLSLLNKSIANNFEVGKEYYSDFSEA